MLNPQFYNHPPSVSRESPRVHLLHGTFQELHVHSSNHKKGLVDEYNTMKCSFEKVFNIDWYESNVDRWICVCFYGLFTFLSSAIDEIHQNDLKQQDNKNSGLLYSNHSVLTKTNSVEVQLHRVQSLNAFPTLCVQHFVSCHSFYRLRLNILVVYITHSISEISRLWRQ